MRLHAWTCESRRDSPTVGHRGIQSQTSIVAVGLTNRKGLLQGLPIDRLDASGEFVLPAMPGTGHATALDGPFGEGTALVGTHPIECVEHPITSKYR